jgi:beta-xylosidase
LKKSITIIFLFAAIVSNAQNKFSKVWVADNANGTFTNPIIHADYSDPDAIRVGDDYYMISSSFNHVPGLPILHSKDLVNWQLIGHALKKFPSTHYDTVQHGNGVWAPAIRYHNREFYIYYPDPDFGIYLIKAKNITGPWSEPILVEAGKGLIDPCPLWDETVASVSNGWGEKVYLVHAYAGSRAGIKSIIVVKELNKDGTKIIGDAVMVYDGHEADPTIEGPKFYKRNGFYYIFAPAGGVSTGWQTVLRSKNVYGPYERKVVLDKGTTNINGPHQGAWVTTQTGEDWFLHFQDKDAYGRVVHLQPMKWVNDWPVIGADKDGDGKAEPVLAYKKPNVGKSFSIITPAESDEFNSTKLGLQWQWQANPKKGWAYPTSNGTLRMFSVYQSASINSLWNTPNILGQKFPAEEFTATVKFSFNPKFENEQFGLIVFGTDYEYISIKKKSDGLYAYTFAGEKADKGNKEAEMFSIPAKGNNFYLQVKVEKGGLCHFAFSEDGERFTTVIKSFIAKPGKWVGAKIGMFCLRDNITNDAGFADVDWFRIEK